MNHFSVNDYFIETMHLLNVTKEKNFNSDNEKRSIYIFIKHKFVWTLKFKSSKFGNNILTPSEYVVVQHFWAHPLKMLFLLLVRRLDAYFLHIISVRRLTYNFKAVCLNLSGWTIVQKVQTVGPNITSIWYI